MPYKQESAGSNPAPPTVFQHVTSESEEVFDFRSSSFAQQVPTNGVCHHAGRNAASPGGCANDDTEQCARCFQAFCHAHLEKWLDGEPYCDVCRDIEQQQYVIDVMTEGSRRAVYLTSTIESTLRLTGQIEAADVFTGIGVYLTAKLAYLDDTEFYRSGNARAAIEDGIANSMHIQHKHEDMWGEPRTSSAVAKLMGPGPWPTRYQERDAMPVRDFTVELRKRGGGATLWRLRGNDEDARRIRTLAEDLVDGGLAIDCAIHDRALGIIDPLTPREVELRLRQTCGQEIPDWMVRDLTVCG